MDNIVESLFGLTPFQVQQQQNAGLNQAADHYASQDPFQRATGGMFRAGGMLGGAGAQAAGMMTPDMQQAQRTQAIMASGGDLQTSAGLKAKAKQFADAGDQQTAMKLLMLAQDREAKEAKSDPFGQIAPKDYTPESIAVYMRTKSPADLRIPTTVAPKDKPTTDIEEYEYAKKNDGYKGTLEQWRLTAKRAGAPGGTTIVMPGDKKYAEKRMEGRANSMADLEKTAESAFKSNLALDRFVAASPNGASGAVQPIYTATENFLSSFGYTSDNLKSVALMEQAIGDILGSKMAELGARGLTDKDMEVLRQALPRVATDKQARVSVANVIKKANENTISAYESELNAEREAYPDLKIPTKGWHKQYKLRNPVATKYDDDKEARYQEWKRKQAK